MAPWWLEARWALQSEVGSKLIGPGHFEPRQMLVFGHNQAGCVTGLTGQSVESAAMRTPDGHSHLELSRFLTPPAVADHRTAPVNSPGYLRVMFAVDDIDETLVRLFNRGAQLVGEVVGIRIRIGSATSADLKGFSSDTPKNLAERNAEAMTNSVQPFGGSGN